MCIRDRTKAKSPFSPNKFITSETLLSIFPKTGVSGPKINPINTEIVINKPSISDDLYKNFFIFLNLKISIFFKIEPEKVPGSMLNYLSNL